MSLLLSVVIEIILTSAWSAWSVAACFFHAAGVVKRPKCVPGDRSACVKIEVSSLISIETFHDCRALGRFALRSRGRTCAVGICDSVKVKRPTAGSDKKAA